MPGQSSLKNQQTDCRPIMNESFDMTEEGVFQSVGPESSHAYVINRRRYINQYIAINEPSGHKLREFQAQIEMLRAVSGSPGVALRGILAMIVENIDQLSLALELQLNDLGNDERLAEERGAIHKLFSDIDRIREGARNALTQL
jgi:hypothetical protein